MTRNAIVNKTAREEAERNGRGEERVVRSVLNPEKCTKTEAKSREIPRATGQGN